MRPKVLEIAWHETQAVYSCDFQPLPPAQVKRLLPPADDSDVERENQKDKDKVPIPVPRQYRLATSGGDSKVRLWMIHPNIPAVSPNAHAALTGQEVTLHPPRAEYLTTLSKHTAAVNVVRFSPNGQILASAGDDGNVILWVPSDRPVATFGETPDDVPDKEHWRLQKLLQVTTKHVYDLAWSPDGEFFIAGATDNTATIWKAATGECVFALREHTHNVQGVAWDPLNEYIATQSSDSRSVHVNTFAFRNGVPDVHPVSRATRMEIRHSRTPSFPSAPRPNLTRRASTTSEAGSVITLASEMTDLPHHPSASVPPLTPSASVPSTPMAQAQAQGAPAALSAMNPPPTKPTSRRSSFSGSQAAASPSLSAIAFQGRGRSPSPIPPLPAIRTPSTSAQAAMQRLYGDEGATRFFRRLSFSPDGSLLLTPAGQIEDQVYRFSPMLISRSLSQDGTGPTPSDVPRPKVGETKPTVYIYSRANLAKAPVAHLPGHKTSSVAIRFSPVFYDLRTGPGAQSEPKNITLDRSDPAPVQVSLSMPPPPPPSKEKERDEKEKEKPLGSIFALPYRLLYAVVCQDSVLLYDTQQSGPIAIFKGLHYAGFTDGAWSPDGQALMLSSSDGYCSIIVFDLAELGTVHPTQQHHRQLQAIAQSHSYLPHHHSLSASSTPVPNSPRVSTMGMRQSPAPPRSEREGSTASSIALPPSAERSRPYGMVGASIPPPPSPISSTEAVPRTPDETTDTYTLGMTGRSRRSESGSSTVGLGLGFHEETKRPSEGTGTEEGPKKKRRVVLTHLGESK
ncbi:chromatin assembly factor 1 subunit B [Tremella mesenterica]|uniref:Chromatin assembly factor 1 subunit B n=1 Tax=Tremella mesenterica TaxID=5217 RepID=A0A4V1M4Y5_TREME|nr:chromatin assembly factor 1 subunit B [Tremella mesenterica]